MKFFHALIILATSIGVATAKDPSRASDSKQERARKRFLRIKTAESGRRRTQCDGPCDDYNSPPFGRNDKGCVEGPIDPSLGTCCINNVRSAIFGKTGKNGIVVPVGDTPTGGCAEVCRPICAKENAGGPPDGAPNYPPDTCIDPDPQGPPDHIAEFLAEKDFCPVCTGDEIC